MPNELNKSQFISLLGNRLQTKGFIVLQSSNDANELIVKCAVEINFTGNACAVIADDTDLLVQPRMIDIFLLDYCIKTQQIRTENSKFEKCNRCHGSFHQRKYLFRTCMA